MSNLSTLDTIKHAINAGTLTWPMGSTTAKCSCCGATRPCGGVFKGTKQKYYVCTDCAQDL